MIQVTDVRIEPNPAAAGGELEIEITIEETYSNAKRYPGKYPTQIRRDRASGRTEISI